jgi:EmrB/QacA subfamily drug resistance transporter
MIEPAGGNPRKWPILALVGTGTFMSALDGSIVNIALPVIGRATGAAISTLEWVVLGYMVTLGVTLLPCGRLGDLYGNRRIYLAGQLCFGLGSLLCGLAGGIALLITARVLQAMGGAMLLALSPAVLVEAFPAQERGKALGLQATMTYLGMSVGPGLGGFLTQHWGWPSIFFINVPISLILFGISLRVLDRDGRRAAVPFDRLGTAAMAVALGTLLLALSQGPERGWTRPGILALLVVSFLAWLLFFGTEVRIQHPILDVRLFRSRVFSASTLAALLCYTNTAATNFLMPFFLIRGCGLPSQRAGLAMMMVPLGMLLLTAVSGHWSDRSGPRPPTLLGMVLMALGAFLVRALTTRSPMGHIFGSLLLIGLGAGLFTAPNNSAIMGAAPRNRQGVAGAILADARTLGYVCGATLGGLLFTLETVHHPGLTDQAMVLGGLGSGMVAVALLALAAAALSLLRGHREGSLARGVFGCGSPDDGCGDRP